MKNLAMKLSASVLPVLPPLTPLVEKELRATAQFAASNIRGQKSPRLRQQLIVCALHTGVRCEGADSFCCKWLPLHMALALRTEKISLDELCDGIRRFLDSPLQAASGCQRCAAFREDFHR